MKPGNTLRAASFAILREIAELQSSRPNKNGGYSASRVFDCVSGGAERSAGRIYVIDKNHFFSRQADCRFNSAARERAPPALPLPHLPRRPSAPAQDIASSRNSRFGGKTASHDIGLVILPLAGTVKRYRHRYIGRTVQGNPRHKPPHLHSEPARVMVFKVDQEFPCQSDMRRGGATGNGAFTAGNTIPAAALKAKWFERIKHTLKALLTE